MLIQSYVNKTEVISKITETYFPTEFNERRQLYEQETNQRLNEKLIFIKLIEYLIFFSVLLYHVIILKQVHLKFPYLFVF